MYEVIQKLIKANQDIVNTVEQLAKKTSDIQTETAAYINATHQLIADLLLVIGARNPDFLKDIDNFFAASPLEHRTGNSHYLQLIEAHKKLFCGQKEPGKKARPEWFQGVILGNRDQDDQPDPLDNEPDD